MATIVRWFDLPMVQCNHETINKLIDKLEKSDLRKIDFYSIRKFSRVYNTWCINVTKDKGVLIRVVDDDGAKQYCFNVNQASRDDVERPSGAKAYQYVESFFNEFYGNKKSLFQAFSAIKYKKEYNEIKLCVPKPINFMLKKAEGKKLDHCWKADVSSAYPFEGTKKLPTLEGCQKFKGTKKPTKDFPFAFYTKSHHIAIYNELDTHNWANYKEYYTLYEEQFDDNVEDETILCKESSYSLKPVFDSIYQKKLNGESMAKFGMNAFIGFCHKNSNPRLSHVAACILARCCDRMLSTTKKIEAEDNKNIVIFIATDSIIWRGNRSEFATDDKYFGSFTYEHHDCQFFAQGPKAYQIISDNGEIITKYAGMKNGSDKDKIKFGKLPVLKGKIKYVINNDGRIEGVYL